MAPLLPALCFGNQWNLAPHAGRFLIRDELRAAKRQIYGSGGPSSVEDHVVTGEADFTLSPAHQGKEVFVWQTR